MSCKCINVAKQGLVVVWVVVPTSPITCMYQMYQKPYCLECRDGCIHHSKEFWSATQHAFTILKDTLSPSDIYIWKCIKARISERGIKMLSSILMHLSFPYDFHVATLKRMGKESWNNKRGLVQHEWLFFELVYYGWTLLRISALF